jgi:hypothetical protein
MTNTYTTKSKLKQFIKLHSKAQAVIIRKNNILVLSTFNGYHSIKRFSSYIEKRYQDVYFSHIEYIANANGDSTAYSDGVLNQFKEFLNLYTFKDDLYCHKNLIVLDSNENPLDYDLLPLDVKKEISLFISIQKKSLTCFIMKLSGDNGTMLISNSLKWLSSKTDFIELASALFENNSVAAQAGKLSKKEFINVFSNFFGIDIPNPEKITNKAMLREKPTQFIDKLKSRLTSYYDNLVNNIK